MDCRRQKLGWRLASVFLRAAEVIGPLVEEGASSSLTNVGMKQPKLNQL